MENLISSFQEALRKLGVTKKNRLLLAVSGGLDSVVLAACCSITGLDFGIAHANFQLRGSESERDADFVRQLAGHYGKPFFLQKFDTLRYAENEKCSIQVAARNLRYDWFKTFIGTGPEFYQFLLTAHHLDDNIETMLMHFFRGTGITGLTGMPVKNGTLVRPLLSISKNSLKAFAISQNLDWVEDSSNASEDYTRNYFRNQLIPYVTTIFPNLHQNLENNLHRFSEASVLYEQAIRMYKKKLLTLIGSETHIPVLLLKKVIPLQTILYEIIRHYHFSPAQTPDVIRLMDSTNGKFVSSSSHRIIKNRRWLIIAPLENASASHIVIEQNESPVNYPAGSLLIDRIEVDGSGSYAVPGDGECFDEAKIKFPLLLRKWKSGDYFYPLGMKKKKKLARFFIDQKLSKTAKEKVWVLVTDSQIVWVVGHRIDNRFRMSGSTTRILQIRNGDASAHS
jgi:tRNA(Ile)-lysidine synthase